MGPPRKNHPTQKGSGWNDGFAKKILQDAKGNEDANSSQRNCVICDLAKKCCHGLGCPGTEGLDVNG